MTLACLIRVNKEAFVMLAQHLRTQSVAERLLAGGGHKNNKRKEKIIKKNLKEIHWQKRSR